MINLRFDKTVSNATQGLISFLTNGIKKFVENSKIRLETEDSVLRSSKQNSDLSISSEIFYNVKIYDLSF